VLILIDKIILLVFIMLFYCDLLWLLSIKWLILIFCFLVLVGAFSDFGRADTGNPVQILPRFSIFEAWAGI